MLSAELLCEVDCRLRGQDEEDSAWPVLQVDGFDPCIRQ